MCITYIASKTAVPLENDKKNLQTQMSELKFLKPQSQNWVNVSHFLI